MSLCIWENVLTCKTLDLKKIEGSGGYDCCVNKNKNILCSRVLVMCAFICM